MYTNKQKTLAVVCAAVAIVVAMLLSSLTTIAIFRLTERTESPVASAPLVQPVPAVIIQPQAPQAVTEAVKPVVIKVRAPKRALHPSWAPKPPSEAWTATYGGKVQRLAEQHDLPPQLLMAVIAVESGFNNNAKSKGNCLGLMQLKLATARENGLPRSAPVSLLYDSETNMEVGSAYLARAYRKADGNICRAITLYNRGLYTKTKGINNDYCRKVRYAMQHYAVTAT